MDLICQGHSSKQVAYRLGLTCKTVENYRAQVMERMQAESLAQLVRMAVALEMTHGSHMDRHPDQADPGQISGDHVRRWLDSRVPVAA
jgi:hypothetical protein